MNRFDKDFDINADTPFFSSMFIPLEHSINDFKGTLENAILDIVSKIEYLE